MKHDVQRFPTWDCVRSMSFYPKAPHPAAHVPLRPWHLAAPHLTRCCRVAFSRDAATWGFSWCTTAMGNRGGDHRNSRDIHVASPDVFFCFECQVKPRSWHSYSVVFISFHNISYHFISISVHINTAPTTDFKKFTLTVVHWSSIRRCSMADPQIPSSSQTFEVNWMVKGEIFILHIQFQWIVMVNSG